MTARNETTGDLIKSKPTNQAFRDGWDRIEANRAPPQNQAIKRGGGAKQDNGAPPQQNPKEAIKDVFKPKNNNS